MPIRKYPRKTYKKNKRSIKILLKALGVVMLLFFLLGVGVFVVFFRDLPRPEKFTEGLIAQSTKIYDRTGRVLLYEIAGEEKRTLVPLSKIPERLKQAVIATEDKNFYLHRGIDLRAIVRAVFYDLRIGKLSQGASTVSQQLIRTYFLSRQKTLKRKTREVILTLEMERRYPKDQILEWYLNLIPFGGNLYGVETASQAFFKKPVQEISLAEAALLTALIKAPSDLWPYGPNLKELIKRKDFILGIMEKEGYINQAEKESALKEKIIFEKYQSNPIKAPHFVLFVKALLEQKYGPSFLEKAGLKVTTTLDIDLQDYAENLVEKHLETLKLHNAHNGALVALDPKTGEVLVMVGSKDYFGKPEPENCTPGVDCLFDPQVNVALALRQPGSAFKPFVYAQAFLKGFSPETLIWDVPTEFNPNCSPAADQEKDRYGLSCYNPKNYDNKFKGLINLRTALAQSRNLASVKVLYLAGLKETLDLAKSLGITNLRDENKYGLALVLGGGEVKLLELVSAYGVFAQDGIRAPLNFIKKIEDASGNTQEERKNGSARVLPSQTARQINNILSDNEARAPVFGRSSPLYIKDWEAAVKTGTTQFFNDAWAVGYTPTLVSGVWVGNNNNSSMSKEGLYLAGPIWHNFMTYALQKFPKENFVPVKPVVQSEKPMLGGRAPEEPHSLLYFVNKKNPEGPPPEQPEQDPQFQNWELSVQNYLNSQ